MQESQTVISIDDELKKSNSREQLIRRIKNYLKPFPIILILSYFLSLFLGFQNADSIFTITINYVIQALPLTGIALIVGIACIAVYTIIEDNVKKRWATSDKAIEKTDFILTTGLLSSAVFSIPWALQWATSLVYYKFMLVTVVEPGSPGPFSFMDTLMILGFYLIIACSFLGVVFGAIVLLYQSIFYRFISTLTRLDGGKEFSWILKRYDSARTYRRALIWMIGFSVAIYEHLSLSFWILCIPIVYSALVFQERSSSMQYLDRWLEGETMKTYMEPEKDEIVQLPVEEQLSFWHSHSFRRLSIWACSFAVTVSMIICISIFNYYAQYFDAILGFLPLDEIFGTWSLIVTCLIGAMGISSVYVLYRLYLIRYRNSISATGVRSRVECIIDMIGVLLGLGLWLIYALPLFNLNLLIELLKFNFYAYQYIPPYTPYAYHAFGIGLQLLVLLIPIGLLLRLLRDIAQIRYSDSLRMIRMFIWSERIHIFSLSLFLGMFIAQGGIINSLPLFITNIIIILLILQLVITQINRREMAFLKGGMV